MDLNGQESIQTGAGHADGALQGSSEARKLLALALVHPFDRWLCPAVSRNAYSRTNRGLPPMDTLSPIGWSNPNVATAREAEAYSFTHSFTNGQTHAYTYPSA